MTWQRLTNCVHLLQNTPSGVQAHGWNSCNNSICEICYYTYIHITIAYWKTFQRGKKNNNKNGSLCFKPETFSLAHERQGFDWPVGRWPAAGPPNVPLALQMWVCQWDDPASSPAWSDIYRRVKMDYARLVWQHNLVHANAPLQSYISVGAYSGGLILVPSLSLLQKDSSMHTPGYGEAPVGERRKCRTENTLCLLYGLFLLVITDRERRSPTEEPRTTRRRFAWCTPGQRWSREPSTSEGGVPGGTEGRHVLHQCG